MEKCTVVLLAPRCGPAGSNAPGDPVEVSLLEAGRLLRGGKCKPVEPDVRKAIVAAEKKAAAEVETAAASAETVETAAGASSGAAKADETKAAAKAAAEKKAAAG